MSPGLTITAKTNMDSNIGDMVDPDTPQEDDKPNEDTGLE
mgnify:CR=1 FL=1